MKIIALTGAGISKSAGIPTYEEMPDLKEKLTLEYKKTHPVDFYETRKAIIKNFEGKLPTKAHNLLAYLQIPIITMNIDNLHRMAGSKIVLDIHGNYVDDDIVLYDQQILHSEKALTLVIKTAREAKKNDEESILLVIGTSMQTLFPHILVRTAEEYGMKVVFINQNADKEVPEFFISILNSI